MITQYKNKIKSGFAEEVCINHFKYLGFDVTKTGLKYLAPRYSTHMSENEMQNILNKTSDLMVTNNEKILFVEVKFTTTINNDNTDFYDYGENLLFEYRYMLFRCSELGLLNDKEKFIEKLQALNDDEIKEKICEDFVFYVVLDKKTSFNSYVYIFTPSNYKSIENGKGWRNARTAHVNSVLDIENFNTGYTDVVEPVLSEIYNYS